MTATARPEGKRAWVASTSRTSDGVSPRYVLSVSGPLWFDVLKVVAFLWMTVLAFATGQRWWALVLWPALAIFSVLVLVERLRHRPDADPGTGRTS